MIKERRVHYSNKNGVSKLVKSLVSVEWFYIKIKKYGSTNFADGHGFQLIINSELSYELQKLKIMI